MKLVLDFLPLLLFFASFKYADLHKDWAALFASTHFGFLVAGGKVGEFDRTSLVHAMTGRPLTDTPPSDSVQAEAPPVLSVEGLTLRGAFADASPDTQDGLRLSWPDRWVHVRPSGTEPIVRVIAEAPSRAEAQALVDRSRDALRLAERPA